MSIRIKNYGEFSKVLKDYMAETRRNVRKVLDTKAYYIARGALRETEYATTAKITFELLRPGGSRVSPTAPLAAIIINRQLGRKNEPGLYGSGTRGNVMVRNKFGKDVMRIKKSGGMKQAVERFVNIRFRSSRFIKSGWIQPIKDLERWAEAKSKAPARDSSVKQFGRSKGRAQPAGSGPDGPKARAVITNAASGNHDHKDALEKYGQPALLAAWQNEIASMKQYMIDKQVASAKKLNIKVET